SGSVCDRLPPTAQRSPGRGRAGCAVPGRPARRFAPPAGEVQAPAAHGGQGAQVPARALGRPMTWLAVIAGLAVLGYFGAQVATFSGDTKVLAHWLVVDFLLRSVLAIGVAGLAVAIVGMAGWNARIHPLPIALVIAGTSVAAWKEFAFIGDDGSVEVDPDDRWDLSYLTLTVCLLASVPVFLS